MNTFDAKTAARLLGVKPASLYAYVSRGLVRSAPNPRDAKARLYVRADIEVLLKRKNRARKPATAAATALDWGMPVLETAITHIEAGRLLYRGQDTARLARTETFESIAALLWDASGDPFADADFSARDVPGWSDAAARLAQADATDRAGALLSLLLPSDAPLSPRPHAKAAVLTRALACAAAGTTLSRTAPLHIALSTAWKRPTAAEHIRRALILCADHELNVSTFTVRVVASAGASLTSALIAGLMALSGPKHGRATARVSAMLDSLGSDATGGIVARIRRGEDMIGFGHPLYPDGDPRAIMLLRELKLPKDLRLVVRSVEAETGLKPSVDFALAALERTLALPAGAALALFAIGRSAGWVAHYYEQQTANTLIRPRATFIGSRALL